VRFCTPCDKTPRIARFKNRAHSGACRAWLESWPKPSETVAGNRASGKPLTNPRVGYRPSRASEHLEILRARGQVREPALLGQCVASSV
jgi:hypothetical protein